MADNHNEAIAGVNAFKAFAEQFGDDNIYTRIIIEVLLEELLNNFTQPKEENGPKNN